jgi:hypothetical protein
MEELSLHILDVAENAIRAGARRVEIRVVESPTADRLLIEISDDGCGMSEELRQKVLDPFFTTKEGKRIGLGVPFLAESAREAGGDCTIESSPGKGTQVRAEYQYGHIDRRPLGDLQATFETLLAGNPEIEFRFEYTTDDGTQIFDTSCPWDEVGPAAPKPGTASAERLDRKAL